MSFPYTIGIPNPPSDPSVDAPNMQTNTNTINAWTSVDHIGFNQSLGGQHAQVTLPANSSPGSQTGFNSVVYTTPGAASSAASQLDFKNSLGNFLLSGIRAYATCDVNGTPLGGNQQFNVTSVTIVGAGQYNVVLASNAVSSNQFGVLALANINNSFNSGCIPGYVVTGVGTFQLNFVGLTGAFGVNPSFFTFIVFQI